MNPTDIAQIEKRSVVAIALPVKPVEGHTGPAGLLPGLSKTGCLPVIDAEHRVVGLLRDADFLQNPQTLPLGDGMNPDGENRPVVTLPENATVKDAWTLFQEGSPAMIPLVDKQGRYTGFCASRQELIRLLSSLYRPPRLGGLATPLGIYMTTGVYSSGSGLRGLVATGIAFAVMLRGIDLAYLVAYSFLLSVFPLLGSLNPGIVVGLQMTFVLASLFALIRLTPISGLHAAEHMTIGAIENGLEVTEANVRRQPKEHLRCGTNLMVLLIGIQSGWLSTELLRPWLSPIGMYLYLFVWIIALSLYWKKAGLWIQKHFTTKAPSAKQLENGMAAGRELLEKFSANPHLEPNFFRRLWGAGFLQIMASFWATHALLEMLLNRWL